MSARENRKPDQRNELRQSKSWKRGGGFVYGRRIGGWAANWRTKLHSVFVDNLSLKVTTKLMWDAFSDYGKVADVYIQQTNESKKKGRVTFGFVRFWKEFEARNAIFGANHRMLEGIRIRTAKAKPSHSSTTNRKYEESEQSTKKGHLKGFRAAIVDGRSFRDVAASQVSREKISDRKEEGNLPTEVDAFPQTGGCIMDGKDKVAVEEPDHGNDKSIAVRTNSYVTPVNNIGSKSNIESHSEGSTSQKSFSWKSKEAVELDIEIPEEDMLWLHRSVIARLKDNVLVEDVQRVIKKLGLKVEVIPLSNVKALLLFDEVAGMESFLHYREERMTKCCSQFEAWESSSYEREFLVWIKMEEVPLFLWHYNFFSAIGNKWGSVIKVAESTTKKSSLEAAWVLVDIQSLVSIPALVAGTWKGFKFVIKVSVDPNFSEDSGLYGKHIVKEAEIRDDGSSHRERSSGTKLFLEIPYKDDSVEVVPDSLDRNIHGDNSNGCAEPASEEEQMRGGGWLVQNKEDLNLEDREVGNVRGTLTRGDNDNSLVKDQGHALEIGLGPKDDVANMGLTTDLGGPHSGGGYRRLDLIKDTEGPHLESCNMIRDEPMAKGILERYVAGRRELSGKAQVQRKKKQKKSIAYIMNKQGEISPSSPESSITDSDIKRRNSSILKEAEAIWEVSLALGVVFEYNREEVIAELVAQEEENED